MMRNFFTTNTLLKLVSLALAVILWFIVVSGNRSEIVIDVPVEFINLSPSLEITDAPKTISIGLEGQERLLKKLKHDDISVVIDLNGYTAGKILYPLSEDNVRLPKSFVIKSIYPGKISLTLKEQRKDF